MSKRGSEVVKVAARLPFTKLEAVADREELLTAFQSSADPRVRLLAERLCDPNFRHESLNTAARAVGATYAEAVAAITKHRVDIGLLRMSDHVGTVLEDTAIDAKSREDDCPECGGAGEYLPAGSEVMRKCRLCKGRKRLRTTGDPDARKLIFETVGLTGKRGPLVAQQFNFGGGDSHDDDIIGASKLLEAAK